MWRRELDGTVPVEEPHVCPGCHAVNAPCAPGCVDAAMAREREEADDLGDGADDHDDEEGWGVGDDEDGFCAMGPKRATREAAERDFPTESAARAASLAPSDNERATRLYAEAFPGARRSSEGFAAEVAAILFDVRRETVEACAQLCSDNELRAAAVLLRTSPLRPGHSSGVGDPRERVVEAARVVAATKYTETDMAFIELRSALDALPKGGET